MKHFSLFVLCGLLTGLGACSEVGQELCSDNLDNDGNGAIDCGDAACINDPSCDRCGDGILDGALGEDCDGQNLGGQSCQSLGFDEGTLACDAACQFNTTACVLNSICGDGFEDPSEQCDDGNAINNDACLNTCQDARCGDGVVQNGVEQCDDQNATNGDGCENNCTSTPGAGGGLVINEVDYDQLNTDAASFIEIFNGGAAAVTLSDLTVVLVNGGDSQQYARIDLGAAGASLGAGQFLVIANDTVAAGGALEIVQNGDFIQNGPDAVVLFRISSGQILDALSYEAGIASATTDFGNVVLNGAEAVTTAADLNDDASTLVRIPNGSDTNNASVDWQFRTTATPGAAN
jgi:cysteine-rich repeat protein